MLTNQQVAELKSDLASGMKQKEAGKKYKISRSTVSDIATGRIYKSIPWPDGLPRRRKGEDHVADLESEILHLRAERDAASKATKIARKEHGLFRAIVNELEAKVRPFSALPKQPIKPKSKGLIEEHVVMHLSDGHHDQIVRPSECGGLEEYNFPISCARAERYVDTVIEWTQSTLSNFRFPHLSIFAYGDHSSGEIHGHTQRSYYRNMFNNCFAIGQLHALMIRDLAAFFPSISVVYLSGNHGRRSEKKDHHAARDNWDYLIGKLAETHCRDLDNVSFLIPDSFSINVEVNGIGFGLSHGDDVRGNSGVPFYGMIRRQKNLIALSAVQGGPPVRYQCMGHHHVSAALADCNGELLVNGAWLGTDAYAYNSFAGYREPCQLLHGVHNHYGVTWRLPVKLKHEGEKIGPRRYKIDSVGVGLP